MVIHASEVREPTLQDVEDGGDAVDAQDQSATTESLLVGSTGDQRNRQSGRSLVRIGFALLVGAAIMWAGVSSFHNNGQGSSESQHADVYSKVNLASATDVGDSLADGFNKLADSLDQIQDSYNQMKEGYNNVSDMYQSMNDSMYNLTGDAQGPMHKLALIRLKLQHMNATEKAAYKKKLFKKFNITSFKQLKVIQKLHDGNPCLDDEELFGNLCYAKCRNLTGGMYPYRMSGFSCCMVDPATGTCGVDNSKTSGAGSFNCEGYNVAGKTAGYVCPHSPGACLATEEFRHNICYKKCALLTYDHLTYREAADTCCVKKATWGALDFGKCVTKTAFAVGGGHGDGDPDTPDYPHPPYPEFTELPNKTNKTNTN